MENLDPFIDFAIQLFNFIIGFLGGLDESFMVLIDFIIINLLIYLIYLVHCKAKKVLSLFTAAVIKKLIVLSIIGVAQSLDTLTGVEAIRTVTIYFFIAGEAKYILQFAAYFGINVPDKIITTLDSFGDMKGNDINKKELNNKKAIEISEMTNVPKKDCKEATANISETKNKVP